MAWKKKLKSYRGKNDSYSFRNKLKKEKKLNDTFESILNTLTLEEIISLKLELSSCYINNRLYNIPIYNSLIYITREAVLNYALSATRTKADAARFLGIDESTFKSELKKFNIST